MQKFRASYSVLSKWATGLPEHQEEAIRMYFKIPTKVESYMKDGQDLHKAWEDEVKQTKSLPAVFGSRKLGNHKLEQKIVAPVADWLELVGVIDLMEFIPEIGGWQVTDYKSGDGGKAFYQHLSPTGDLTPTTIPVPHKTSTSHLGRHQLGIYACLAQHLLSTSGDEVPTVKRVCIMHLNQVTGEVDTAYKWVDNAMLLEAIDWVVTWSSDMHSLLESKNVYADPWKYLGIEP